MNYELTTERQNGAYYYGRSLNLDMHYLSVGEFLKTSKNISKQKIVLKYPVTITGFHKKFATLEFGVAQLFDKYRDYTAAAHFKAKTKHVDLELAGFNNLELVTVGIHHKFKLGGGVFLEPNGSYFYDGSQEDFRLKVRLGVQIN